MKKHKYLFVACLSLFSVMAVAEDDTRNESREVRAAAQINKSRLYKGKVVDDKTSEPLVGATVRLKGSAIGTITDMDGNFKLDVPSNISPIVFEISYMGYASKEATPNGTNGFTIRLTEDSQTLEEVQIIAYGKQSKMSVTAAVSSIDTKELLKSPSGSVANALSGAVTGLSSIQSSGQPGAEDPSIYIRGTGSLSDELSKPLILVDGVERSFFQMDSHEIESITILKDAASTAVFGVRGANGVVLVTTRRGASGKPSITLNSSFGLTQSLRNLKGVDSYTYATLYNETQLGDNPSLKESQLGFSPYIIDMFRTNEDPIMFPNVDWNEYLFKNLAWQTQHNLTMSGGGERFRYFVSLGYL
ncbi:MAG: SusC/RagA family TonB-linked outer membrane protein, partial [Bacteroides sp.]|nr:SusC/RagA family TonB-linked outer membrane protein [Bacteroides sp.]